MGVFGFHGEEETGGPDTKWKKKKSAGRKRRGVEQKVKGRRGRDGGLREERNEGRSDLHDLPRMIIHACIDQIEPLEVQDRRSFHGQARSEPSAGWRDG